MALATLLREDFFSNLFIHSSDNLDCQYEFNSYICHTKLLKSYLNKQTLQRKQSRSVESATFISQCMIKTRRGVVQTSHMGGHQSPSLPFTSPLPSPPFPTPLPSLPFPLPLPSPSLPCLPLPSPSLPPVPSLPLPLEVVPLKSS